MTEPQAIISAIEIQLRSGMFAQTERCAVPQVGWGVRVHLRSGGTLVLYTEGEIAQAIRPGWPASAVHICGLCGERSPWPDSLACREDGEHPCIPHEACVARERLL